MKTSRYSAFVSFCLCVVSCTYAYSAEHQMTFEGEVHTSDIIVGKDGISNQDGHITFTNYDISLAEGSMLIVDQDSPFALSSSTLKIDGVQAGILLQKDMQVGGSQINVLNGADASLSLQGNYCYINQGSSLNVDGGSTLTLTFAPSVNGGTSVYSLVGETSLTPKAAISVTNNSHLVIRMDDVWVETLLQKLSTNASQSSEIIANFGKWTIDDTSSITLEGRFMDSQYGALTLRSEIAIAKTPFGAGEIGLRWNSDGNGLSIVYKGPPNPYSEPDPYRELDVSTAPTIDDGTFDSMSGSTGTATIQGKVVIVDSISLGEGAVAKLDGQGASVSHGGITISNRGQANDAEIRGGEAGFTVANAVVCVNEDAPAELTITAGLENVLLDNSQADTKLIAKVGAESLAGIRVSGGEVELVPLENAVAVTLELLVVADGGKVSVCAAEEPVLQGVSVQGNNSVPFAEAAALSKVAGNAENALLTGTPGLMEDRVSAGSPASSPASGISIKENGTAQFGTGAELNASLTLESGTHMVFDDVLTMNGQLSLGTGIILSGELLASMGSMQQGDELRLIQGTGAGLSYAEDLDGNAANTYFSNIDAAFRIMANENSFGLVMASAAPAPEPGTGALSLAALAALVTRRRRR